MLIDTTTDPPRTLGTQLFSPVSPLMQKKLDLNDSNQHKIPKSVKSYIKQLQLHISVAAINEITAADRGSFKVTAVLSTLGDTHLATLN